MSFLWKKESKENVQAKEEFTAQEFDKALAYLDKEIGKSKNIRKVAPIKLIAVGGYVSVAYLHNRDITEDVDYILDPAIEDQKKIRQKLDAAVEKVAKSNGYSPEWIDDKVAQFAGGLARCALFRDSLAQNAVIWSGRNFTVYAVKWEWALAWKLKRIGSIQRDTDADDAVAVLHQINTISGTPLDWDVAKGYNALVYSPIEDVALERVVKRYRARYGSDGIRSSLVKTDASHVGYCG